ncbi:MAG: LicD family protein [Clostridiales bacterium]|nr:LicD family protein [Clostridiales bacterium]
MDNNSELRRVQLKEMEIMDAFVKVCEEEGLKYFAVGGTLIGVIRHKGFIPWDDDMDFAMPRKDYDRFLEYASRKLPERFKISHFTTEEGVYFYPLKITDTSVKVTEQRLEGRGDSSCLSVDVFPIDGFPDGALGRLIYKFRYYWRRMMIGFCNVDILRQDVKRSLPEKMLIGFARTFKLNKRMNLKKQLMKYDKFFKSTKDRDCRLIGDISGRYGFREFVDKEIFGEGITMQFEDRMIRVPSHPEDYLTCIYGDFMTLPPEEKRQASHIKILES